MPRGWDRNAAFAVNVGSGWENLARDLRAAGDGGKVLKKELRKEITAAVKPMQADAKANVLSIPTHGRKHTGLRKSIARATKIRVSTSLRALKVRLEVNEKQMPEGRKGLAARMEGIGRPWRHPVYAHPEGERDARTRGAQARLFSGQSKAENNWVWVVQKSHPYLEPAADKHLPRVRVAISRAVDTAIRKIEKGTP